MGLFFEELVAYAEPFDPSYPGSVVPATADQIQLVESLAGRSLPPIYRDFLEVMGQSTGGVDLGPFDLHVERVIEFYRDNQWLSTTQYFRIGEGTAHPIEQPHLEVISIPGRDHEVIGLPDYTQANFETELRRRRPVCGSLLELVGAPLFDKYEMRQEGRNPQRLTAAAPSQSALDSLTSYLLKNGFSRHFFSSHTGRYFTKPGAAIRAWQTYVHPLKVEVSADSSEEQRYWLATLQGTR